MCTFILPCYCVISQASRKQCVRLKLFVVLVKRGFNKFCQSLKLGSFSGYEIVFLYCSNTLYFASCNKEHIFLCLSMIWIFFLVNFCSYYILIFCLVFLLSFIYSNISYIFTMTCVEEAFSISMLQWNEKWTIKHIIDWMMKNSVEKWLKKENVYFNEES